MATKKVKNTNLSVSSENIETAISVLPDNALCVYKYVLQFDVATFDPVVARLHLEKQTSVFRQELGKDPNYVFSNIRLDFKEVAL